MLQNHTAKENNYIPWSHSTACPPWLLNERSLWCTQDCWMVHISGDALPASPSLGSGAQFLGFMSTGRMFRQSRYLGRSVSHPGGPKSSVTETSTISDRAVATGGRRPIRDRSEGEGGKKGLKIKD